MVATTVSPQLLTASTASAVVVCSNTIFLTRLELQPGHESRKGMLSCLQFGKASMKVLEGGEELALSVQDCHVLLVTGDLAVKIEHHANFLHGLENRVEGLIADNTRRTIRGNTCRVGLMVLDKHLVIRAFE